MGFAVEVEAVDFKFSAGHFVAYKGFRERLHGHNYTVKVRLNGEKLNADGYILDFGDVKRETKAACKVIVMKIFKMEPFLSASTYSTKTQMGVLFIFISRIPLCKRKESVCIPFFAISRSIKEYTIRS